MPTIPQKSLTIALSGNPNAGKTSIFNHITGTRQKVGNWPGVTVEKKEGTIRKHGYELRIIDLPGTYSLTPFSIEEIIARDFILEESPDVVVVILILQIWKGVFTWQPRFESLTARLYSASTWQMWQDPGASKSTHQNYRNFWMCRFFLRWAIKTMASMRC